MNARIEYVFAPDATRLLYSSLIMLGLLFVPALMVHSRLQFYEMAAPSTVPKWAKVLVLAPLYVAPSLSFAATFFGPRAPTRIGVRFGPRFGPLDQITPRLVRFFPWTPEATFIFVAILLSLAIDLGVLNLKPKLADTDRRFFKRMIGVSAVAMGLLLTVQLYRQFETPQIEALNVALILVCLLPGTLFGFYEVVIGALDGPVGTAMATLMGGQVKGHTRVFALLNTDVQVRPATLMVSKVTVGGEKATKYTNILMGTVQAAIAHGVLDAVRAGDLPKSQVNELGIICAVWLAPTIVDVVDLDHRMLFDIHRRGMAKAIGKAMRHEPSIDWLLENQDKVVHRYFQMGLEGKI